MSAERIAFIGHLKGKPTTLLKHFSEVRELSEDRPQAKILHAFIRYMDLKKQNSEADDKACIFLMDDDQETLLKEAQKLLRDNISGNDFSPKENEAMKGFFSSLILVKPDTEDNFFQVDKATGIRIWRLRKGETAFPMHPTPAH